MEDRRPIPYRREPADPEAERVAPLVEYVRLLDRIRRRVDEEDKAGPPPKRIAPPDEYWMDPE